MLSGSLEDYRMNREHEYSAGDSMEIRKKCKHRMASNEAPAQLTSTAVPLWERKVNKQAYVIERHPSRQEPYPALASSLVPIVYAPSQY